MKPTCYVMVGLPASGKSTRVQQLCDMDPDVFVYSTDRFIEDAASHFGTTYDAAFRDNIDSATAAMNQYLDAAISDKQNVVWDQTNLGVKKRSKIINRMKQVGYAVECECVLPPETVEDIAEWNRRLHSRQGKTIDEGVITNMVKTFVIPTIEEGFDSVVYWDIYGNLCDAP